MASLIFKLCLLATLASVSSLTSAVIKNPKRGLAFAESTFKSDISKVNTTKSVISWQYDWDQSVPEYLAKSHIPYVPMQWGRNNITNFTSLVKKQGAQIALVIFFRSIAFQDLTATTRDLTSLIFPASRI